MPQISNNYIRIFSHPRSGTHFLESFLASNFYKNENLSSEGAIYFGHWSNKILLEEGEPYHKLFGGHLFPDRSKIGQKSIYIYRDGRAVIASIWNSQFYHKDWRGISFSEFLRKEIDWYGGMGQKSETSINIVQHWYNHVSSWTTIKNDYLLIISYEELKNDPQKVFLKICKKFYPLKYYKAKLFGTSHIDPINRKVGLSPNKASINDWKRLFSQEDLDFFYSQLPSKKFLYSEK
ncbi:sulfotransferase domain-containing protein [Constantimarinum furrinae]|uniref:Sulfotransferase domain-containing protein n=1 Tax=Constantimarinum furrinae TaxID=2562285 RepID=A0A7G8PQV1_9FLAO|nr:sulfotransferase domain-containing protein [Constantimarinum furrinae]QNJ96717.1 hypothetical protein ALE3EI_0126 [Constantimarinum furrinae]